MGIIGIVMGFIFVFLNLINLDEFGLVIVVVFVVILYGVLFVNFIWFNFGKKIKIKVKQERMLNEIIVEGFLLIQVGENLRIFREKIGGMLKEVK